MTSFFAKAVAVVEIPDCETFLVGFAEYPDRDCKSLELQIALEDKPNEGDDNTYCIVTENQATYYGGIIECSLTPSSFKILLTKEACEELGVEGGFTVEFELRDKDELINLRNGLQRILDRAILPFKLLTSTV